MVSPSAGEMDLRGSPLEAVKEGQVKGLFTTLHMDACAKAMVAHGSGEKIPDSINTLM